tara:strand:+ start:126 stop:503 length:378 start_codon:yes stop_codon:yes gene_type:complete
MESEQIMAIFYLLTIASVVLFQLCLIFGAPWGEFTQGGKYDGSLPISGRITALLSIPIIIYMGTSITSAYGLLLPNWADWTAYGAIAMHVFVTILNWISPSKKEKLLWGPITFIMLLLAAYAVII